VILVYKIHSICVHLHSEKVYIVILTLTRIEENALHDKLQIKDWKQMSCTVI